jgi:hypothetical protein
MKNSSKNICIVLSVCAAVFFLASCSSKFSLYRQQDSSFELSLRYYTDILPTPGLGPCGFSLFRSYETYNIKIPYDTGKIDYNKIKVKVSLAHNDSTFRLSKGYIEFLKSDLVFVNLFTEKENTDVPLKINGKHHIWNLKEE